MESVVGSMFVVFFFFQAEDGIRYLVRSRGLGDVYKRQVVKLVRIDDGPGIDHGTARRKRKKDPIVELVGILK